MKETERNKLIRLLHDYKDVFAWSYQDMPGLDTSIVEHKLPLKPECLPVKQKLRRMKPELSLKIREEIKKKFDARFLVVVKYSQWVANIVPVPKKDGKVRMCVDYRDLNRASPKDDFPLSHIDVLRAMVTLFHDMIHNEIEVYVDDMIAKSRKEEDHVIHMKKLFEQLRNFKLRLNPSKCTFGVKYGKLLGFIVIQKGIEVDPDKV
uniref:Transposon Ty3-I Gag-Pol polyprotein n=1 Tax=Cajanus cajan TaxID=3821 RepID=A0A151SZB5_CAJCA|nr:Transposon Ty3-I Gag-Pol polyprotein [Cajanus cajan]